MNANSASKIRIEMTFRRTVQHEHQRTLQQRTSRWRYCAHNTNLADSRRYASFQGSNCQSRRAIDLLADETRTPCHSPSPIVFARRRNCDTIQQFTSGLLEVARKLENKRRNSLTLCTRSFILTSAVWIGGLGLGRSILVRSGKLTAGTKLTFPVGCRLGHSIVSMARCAMSFRP